MAKRKKATEAATGLKSAPKQIKPFKKGTLSTVRTVPKKRSKVQIPVGAKKVVSAVFVGASWLQTVVLIYNVLNVVSASKTVVPTLEQLAKGLGIQFLATVTPLTESMDKETNAVSKLATAQQLIEILQRYLLAAQEICNQIPSVERALQVFEGARQERFHSSLQKAILERLSEPSLDISIRIKAAIEYVILDELLNSKDLKNSKPIRI